MRAIYLFTRCNADVGAVRRGAGLQHKAAMAAVAPRCRRPAFPATGSFQGTWKLRYPGMTDTGRQRSGGAQAAEQQAEEEAGHRGALRPMRARCGRHQRCLNTTQAEAARDQHLCVRSDDMSTVAAVNKTCAAKGPSRAHMMAILHAPFSASVPPELPQHRRTSQDERPVENGLADALSRQEWAVGQVPGAAVRLEAGGAKRQSPTHPPQGPSPRCCRRATAPGAPGQPGGRADGGCLRAVNQQEIQVGCAVLYSFCCLFGLQHRLLAGDKLVFMRYVA